LPALKVIHTVGPVYHDLAPDEAADLLAECYRNALQVARDENLQSIAFPGISTGVYGYPQDEAADVAIAAVLGELSRHGAPREVIFSAFDSGAADAYAQRLPAAVRSMPDQEMRG
jgi:O-acetyl-ADP-ribose deacetylase (regulator of RNase III)